MRATICDRCLGRCEQNTYEVETWLTDCGKRQGSYTLKRDLCQRCYDEVKDYITRTPEREWLGREGGR